MLLPLSSRLQRHPNPNILNFDYLSISMGSNMYEQEAQSLLCNILPSLSITKVRVVPNSGIQQMYSVDIVGENYPVLFTTTHPPWVKPLRSEYCCISSEAALWTWYSVLSSGVRCLQSNDRSSQADGYSDQGSQFPHKYSAKLYLSAFLPSLVKYSPPIPEARIPEYIISRPRPGDTLTSLSQTLDKDDYASIHWQAGQLFRRIACHVSPTGRFGDLSSVVRPLALLPMRPLIHSPANAPYIFGSSSWSDAFHLMLEAVLRDLEDCFVNISYIRIRHHFARLKHLLDNVTRPSLVAITCNDAQNLLVVPSNGEPHPRHNSSTDRNNYRVTGLRDWSMLLFGDPLIATAFTGTAPQSFTTGLHHSLGEDDPFRSISIIEHRESTPIRLLLYNCYHALVDLAKEYYHVRNGDDEMEARRRLMAALNKLDDIDDDGDYMRKLQENSPANNDVRIDTDAIGTGKKFGVAS